MLYPNVRVLGGAINKSSILAGGKGLAYDLSCGRSLRGTELV